MFADPDLWHKAATKQDGTHYYSCILCYVDDIMVMHEKKRPHLTQLHQTKNRRSERDSNDHIYQEKSDVNESDSSDNSQGGGFLFKGAQRIQCS